MRVTLGRRVESQNLMSGCVGEGGEPKRTMRWKRQAQVFKGRSRSQLLSIAQEKRSSEQFYELSIPDLRIRCAIHQVYLGSFRGYCVVLVKDINGHHRSYYYRAFKQLLWGSGARMTQRQTRSVQSWQR